MLCSPPTRAKLKAAIPKLKRAPDADLSLFRGTSVRCLPHPGFEMFHFSLHCIPPRDSAGVHSCPAPGKGTN